VKNCIPLIAQHMKRLVQRYFTAEPLSHYAELFIEDKLKETIRFGPLTVIHYRMFGGELDEPYEAAAAVELFVLASDILDDLQDQDAPDKPWMQVPQPIAIHVASALLTLSQQAMLGSTPNAEIRIALLEMMNTQLLMAANGQMLDLANEITDEQSYLDMVKQKSAAMLQLACMTGVLLAGQPWHPIVAEYAIEIGMAAQIQNDLRDLLRWDDKSDFLKRKLTMLTLYLIELDEEEDQWIKAYFQGDISTEDILLKKELFLETCERTGTILYGSVMSRMHYNRFEELLNSIEEIRHWKTTFLSIINQDIA
jgi:competence protein ComQ